MYIYPAFFYKDDGGYSVVFKDLELATSGATLQEALLMAEEALTGRVQGISKNSVRFLEMPDEFQFKSLYYNDLN